MKRRLLTSVIAIAALSGTAAAEDTYTLSDFPFWGLYLGVNLGGVWNNACAEWTPNVAGIGAYNFLQSTCPNNNAFTGGATLGYNIVSGNIMFGLETDYNAWSSTSRNHVISNTGATAPTGTYSFYGPSSPNGVGTVRLRLGFVSQRLMPYLTGGFAYAGGSSSTTIAYTPAGSIAPTTVFPATRTIGTSGWTLGGGFEYGFSKHFSIKAEYLYMEFGHTSNSGRVDMARVGFNYLFQIP